MVTQQAMESQACTNFIGRIALQSLEETIGKAKLVEILEAADLDHLIENYPPNDAKKEFKFRWGTSLNKALEEVFGPLGSQGVALRTGRAMFCRLLRQDDPHLLLNELDFRTLPAAKKIRKGLEIIADYLTQHFSLSALTFEETDGFGLVVDRQSGSGVENQEVLLSQVLVGVMQEAFYWISGGKNIPVELNRDFSLKGVIDAKHERLAGEGYFAWAIQVGKKPVE